MQKSKAASDSVFFFSCQSLKFWICAFNVRLKNHKQSNLLPLANIDSWNMPLLLTRVQVHTPSFHKSMIYKQMPPFHELTQLGTTTHHIFWLIPFRNKAPLFWYQTAERASDEMRTIHTYLTKFIICDHSPLDLTNFYSCNCVWGPSGSELWISTLKSLPKASRALRIH